MFFFERSLLLALPDFVVDLHLLWRPSLRFLNHLVWFLEVLVWRRKHLKKLVNFDLFSKVFTTYFLRILFKSTENFTKYFEICFIFFTKTTYYRMKTIKQFFRKSWAFKKHIFKWFWNTIKSKFTSWRWGDNQNLMNLLDQKFSLYFKLIQILILGDFELTP